MPEHPSNPLSAEHAVLYAPRAFFFDVADALRITSFNAVASVVVALEGRFLTDTGEVNPFRFDHTPNTDRTSASTTFAMGTGWLLDVQARASSGSPRRGQTFIRVEVVRGLTAAQVPLSTLVQGYVTDTSRLAWPGSPIEAMASIAGVIRSVGGTDPAAGVEISETVPTNARWRVHGVTFTLVTAVAAANREVRLQLDDGATVLLEVPAGVTQVASETRRYSFGDGFPRGAGTQSLNVVAPLPKVTLEDGMRVLTATTNLQAGDDFGAPQLLVEEWIED